MAEKDATTRLRRAVKGLFLLLPSTIPSLTSSCTENNLFLVKRLIQRTEMRNPDTAPQRYTSLAWAAVLGHDETFEFLLSAGHDDDELTRVCQLTIIRYSLEPFFQQDSENNTILMLLADQKPSYSNTYGDEEDNAGAYLRMARLYYDRYSWILDWSNVLGKTALHIAALKGNEELVRVHFLSRQIVDNRLFFFQMLCDLGADFDLSDNKGNTPLH